MVGQTAIGRFARWGLTHGPAWGVLAGALAGIPLARMLELKVSYFALPVLGAVAGLVAGPLLAVVVGLTCLAADRAPRWILDAPDYVAVLTVIVVITLVAWPTLQSADVGPVVAVLGVALIAAPASVDAARSAPRLLRPHRTTHG